MEMGIGNLGANNPRIFNEAGVSEAPSTSGVTMGKEESEVRRASCKRDVSWQSEK